MKLYSTRKTVYSLENVRKVALESYWLDQMEHFRVTIYYTDGANEKIDWGTNEMDAKTSLRIIRTLLKED